MRHLSLVFLVAFILDGASALSAECPNFDRDGCLTNLHSERIHHVVGTSRLATGDSEPWAVDEVEAVGAFANVAGLVVAADRLHIIPSAADCNDAEMLFWAYTKKGNKEILKLKGKTIGLRYLVTPHGLDVRAEAKILDVLEFLQGHGIILSLGVNTIDYYLETHRGGRFLQIELMPTNDIFPEEYLDSLMLEWTLNGFEEAVEKARDLCFEINGQD